MAFVVASRPIDSRVPHGYLDERSVEERSNEPPAQTAIEGCAAIAMRRGHVATMARAPAGDDADDQNDQNDQNEHRSKPLAAVEHDGFNLHAAVRVGAGDDLGRERLARYCARPPLSIERLRRLPGGRVAYRLKYIGRGRGKHRVMTPMEFMARLAAIICPPRYPLVRYSGVLGPRSSWRREIVPRPRAVSTKCTGPRADGSPDGSPATPHAPTNQLAPRTEPYSLPSRSASEMPLPAAHLTLAPTETPALAALAPPASAINSVDDAVAMLAPNIVSVRHWDRLMGGLLYAAQPRVDWATLLRRSFDVDVLECPRCHGRLRVLAVITEREPIERILCHLGLPAATPPLARARSPDVIDDDPGGEQLALDLA